jgi:hypothetical protein
MTVRSASHTSRALLRNIFPLLVLISVRDLVNLHVRLEVLGKLNKFIYVIGNGTRHLLACSIALDHLRRRVRTEQRTKSVYTEALSRIIAYG